MSFDLSRIVEQFDLPPDFLHARPYGSGHINDTFLATFDSRTSNGRPTQYILQRINHEVFTTPEELGENVERVTRHVKARLEAEGCDDLLRRVLILTPSRDGRSWHCDDQGNYWRACNFIHHARTYDTVSSAEQAYQVARAFGRFQEQLRDLPGERLHETIPRFHDAEDRFAIFEKALAADVAGRSPSANAEVDFALGQRETAGVLAGLARRGEIPERITHNDTKVNNVPLDDQTGEALCVLDLDTVMPGLIHYDFGDMVRTMSCKAPEDETDLDKVHLEGELFDALVRGYLEGAGDFLTSREVEYLAFSGKLMTLVIGLRFLTDFLKGDVYFKIKYPTHNLDRARAQFALVRSIAAQERDLERHVAAVHAGVST